MKHTAPTIQSPQLRSTMNQRGFSQWGMGKQKATAVLTSATGTCYMLLEKLAVLMGKAQLKELPEKHHHCIIATQKELSSHGPSIPGFS